MPAFELEQVDGGAPIDVPCGDTILGRGPFLGVSDKRVSRNHAILQNQDGQLRLKPIHTNPCFTQASLEAPPQPLEKDQWHCLKEGSTFSLLPGKYIYRVHGISEESTPRNSQGYEEQAELEVEAEEVSNPPQPWEETLVHTPQAKGGASLHPTSALSETGTRPPSPPSCSQVRGEDPVSRAAQTFAPSIPQRKRVLPAWMMTATPAALSPSPAKAAAKKTPARSTPNPARPRIAAGPRRARARLPSSDEEEEEHSEVDRMPRKRVRRLSSDHDGNQDQAASQVSRMSQARCPGDRVSEEAAGGNVEEGTTGRGRKRAEVPPRSRDRSSPAPEEDSGNSQANKQSSQNGRQGMRVAESAGSSSNTKPKAQRRTPCPYGTSCYRKNPTHFLECSHPGDEDYELTNEDDGDGDDERLECPYGTDCYRKNPLHKKEYKHTKPPVKRSVPGGDEDDDDDDEDHYEDSFINDESEEEEVDEDSDYKPETDDSGKEDVKQLQKEARAFLRKKRK